MKLVYNPKYRDLMVKQVREQLSFFLQNSIEFSIVVNMDSGIDFNPSLPEEVTSAFREFTLFTISGYTFSSAFVKDDKFVFEAGFGRENIGSIVHVDLDRILQIVISETPIFINVTASVEKTKTKDSFNVFASKERNKKFFKKD
jgi:hypothetical protein